MKEPNFELVAIALGDELKWISSINEIERIAKATLKIKRIGFIHENITSERAKLIYDWIMSLAYSNLTLEKKINRCVSFMEQFELGRGTKEKIFKILGIREKKIRSTDSLPDIKKLNIEPILLEILEKRLIEIEKCINAGAYLAAIIMMGSFLEGLLLSVVSSNQKDANLAKSAPKYRDGKVKKFHEWKLQDLISVSHECGWIEVDVKDFSNLLRDYRNMIHPYRQLQKNVYPDLDTTKICWEVLNAALNDLILKKII